MAYIVMAYMGPDNEEHIGRIGVRELRIIQLEVGLCVGMCGHVWACVGMCAHVWKSSRTCAYKSV